MVETGLVERCYRGPAAFRELVSSYAEAWGSEIRMTEVEIIDFGNRLVLLADVTVRGQASGASLNPRQAWVITLKDGKATHQREYFDPAEALEAVGLRE